jgi:5-methyltetrahydropteroyltriglutamate--homocysteine methyltransferase
MFAEQRTVGPSSHDQLRTLRVDNVGSMLRPAHLLEAIRRHDDGQIGSEELRRSQDRAIARLVSAQEAHGLPVIADGEFRRRQFMESFSEVAGFDQWAVRHARARAGRSEADGRIEAPSARALTPATEKLRLRRNAPLDEYRFTQALTERPVKVTLIGPERILSAYDAAASEGVYADVEEFAADVVRVQRDIVRGLLDAGCAYIQIDAPGFTRFADAPSLRRMRAHGEDPEATMTRAITAENALLDGLGGRDVTFGVHLCRGNEQSHWHREGTYDALAEQLFSELRHDRLLLEYDSERAGGFAPLRFVRRDAVVVLGLITTKSGTLEDPDDLYRRIEQAARFVPVERLALSPQCGFASTFEGNELTEDEQWRKLDLMLEVAARVWA